MREGWLLWALGLLVATLLTAAIVAAITGGPCTGLCIDDVLWFGPFILLVAAAGALLVGLSGDA